MTTPQISTPCIVPPLLYYHGLQMGSGWLFKIEVHQIHLSFREDAHGQHVLSSDEHHLRDSLRVFQWCHCRQAMGSDASKVGTIFNGAVAGSPFTSREMVPPRFEV